MLLFFLKNLQNNGISSQIYSLINNEEIRVSTNVLVSTCSAYDYLNNIKPNLEKLTVQYYDTFSITNNFTGYFPDVTIGDFYNEFSTEFCGSTAILVGLDATARKKASNSSSSSESGSSSGGSGGSSSSGDSDSSGNSNNTNDKQNSGQEPPDVITNPEDLIAGKSSLQSQRGTENIGIAVFHEDTFCGVLTATETMCHMLLQKKLDSCVVSVENPINTANKVELQTSPNKKPRITVNVDDDIPKIKIELSINADILTLEDHVNYESNEILEKFSQSAEKYFKKEIENYLNKVCKEYNTDIDYFFSKALSQFSTISEWENYNWKEKYKNAEFDVSVDVNVNSSLLLIKT